MQIQNLIRNIVHCSSIAMLTIGLVSALMGTAYGQEARDVKIEYDTVVNSPVQSRQAMAATMSYWTADRMQNAAPMVARSPGAARSTPVERQKAYDSSAAPVFVPGWNPNSGLPQPKRGARIVLDKPEQKISSRQTNAIPLALGTGAAHPIDWNGYGKFQRYTLFGNYLKFPRSVLGKLFFSNGASNFVCSATVVNRSTLITAGHCVSDGNGVLFINLLFCPSYYKGAGAGAAHPARGCWAGVSSTLINGWHSSALPSFDYACIVTATTGSVIAGKIGDTTGWAGMAYNRGGDELVLSTGYPADAPFPGYHLITTMANEWHDVTFSGDTAASKIIGNDMTGGASGGGWLLNWEHSSARYNAVIPDNTNVTDPYQNTSSAAPFVHGVNSHKRCFGSCLGTPTATNGVYINEMSSPYFNSGGGEVESVYNTCAAHANNNP